VLHSNRARAESFGAVADLYDRARPSYPAELVDALLADGARSVLDIGCGTGIAAVLFAARGCGVLGVEVDARMAALARAKGIAVEVAPFEHWQDRGRRFELLISAQAWHWVEPRAGAARAAAVLAEGGTIGAFWNLGDPPAHVRELLAPIYARLAPELENHAVVLGVHTGRVDETAAGLAACGAFEPAAESWFSWTQSYDTAAWVDFLRTHSDHQALPPARRESLLDAVAEAIESIGGSFEMAHKTVLVSARRRQRTAIATA
jgi:SAM-dependent methyltransferase